MKIFVLAISDDQISDFEPDATMAGISVPEPASLGLLGLSALLLAALRGRRLD